MTKKELAKRVLAKLAIPDTDWPAKPYITWEMVESYASLPKSDTKLNKNVQSDLPKGS